MGWAGEQSSCKINEAERKLKPGLAGKEGQGELAKSRHKERRAGDLEKRALERII